MKKFFSDNNIIEFVDTTQKVHAEFYPTPASNELPDWYKKTEPYIGGNKYPTIQEHEKVGTNATIKRCLPVFDSITAGYILKTDVDVIIRWKDNASYYQWPNGNPINFQGIEQAKKYPGQEGRNYDYPKFNNPWSIRTPPGYSCLITTPMHRDLPFEVMEGIVDTDSFYAPVLFPFYLKEERWEGIIEAGTPMAQIIPFKRESWKMNAGVDQNKTRDAFLIKERVFSSFLNAYRKSFWKKKSWS